MIETIELFPEVNKNLLILLKNIEKKGWLNPTVIPGRTVKDLASHILDGSLKVYLVKALIGYNNMIYVII